MKPVRKFVKGPCKRCVPSEWYRQDQDTEVKKCVVCNRVICRWPFGIEAPSVYRRKWR